MQILCVFRKTLRPSIRQNEEGHHRQNTPAEDDHFSLEQRSADAHVLRRAVPEAPDAPSERLIKRHVLEPEKGCPSAGWYWNRAAMYWEPAKLNPVRRARPASVALQL